MINITSYRYFSSLLWASLIGVLKMIVISMLAVFTRLVFVKVRIKSSSLVCYRGVELHHYFGNKKVHYFNISSLGRFGICSLVAHSLRSFFILFVFALLSLVVLLVYDTAVVTSWSILDVLSSQRFFWFQIYYRIVSLFQWMIIYRSILL